MSSFFWEWYNAYNKDIIEEKKEWEKIMEEEYSKYEEELEEQKEWKKIMLMTDEEYDDLYGSDVEYESENEYKGKKSNKYMYI